MKTERSMELLRRVRKHPPAARPKPGETLKLSKNFRLVSILCKCCDKERFFITRKGQTLSMGHDWKIFHDHFWSEQ